MAKTPPEQSTRRSSLGNEQLAIETGSSLGIAGGQIEPAEVTGNARCGWGPLDPSLATLRCSWPPGCANASLEVATAPFSCLPTRGDPRRGCHVR